jgi:hypothetical protein
MRGTALTWADCESIVDAEVKRVGGRLRGYDPQDLRQEAAIAASRAFVRIDESKPGTGAAFVRTSVRNSLSSLKRAANAPKRCPHTKNGRPLPWYAEVDVEDVEWDLPSPIDPEQIVGARQLVRKLRDELPRDDFDRLVSVLVEGAEIARGHHQRRLESIELELIRAHASQLLVSCIEGTGGETMQKIRGYRPPAKLQPCHADGSSPQGYDPADLQCIGCPDKVVCLPRSIEAGMKPSTLDRALRLEDDREAQAVLGGALSYANMYGRLRERAALMSKHEEIPPELSFDNTALVADLSVPDTGAEEAPEVSASTPKPAPDPEPEQESDTEQTSIGEDESPAEEEEPVARTTARKATKKRGTPVKKKPKKKPAQKAASKTANGKAATSGKGWPMKTPIPAHTNEEGWPLMISGKPYPKAIKLNEEEMQDRLDTLKLGQPDGFAFEYGMRLVRKRRNDDDIKIIIRANGFEFNGVIFGSHSSCLMWALGRVCSGNEHLNIAKSSAAIITDARGKVVLCKAML